MNERISSILKNAWTIPVAVGVTSFGGGLGVGYILGKRRVSKKVEDTQIEQDDQLEFQFDTAGLADSRRIIDEEAYHSPAVIPEEDYDGDEIVRVMTIEEHLEEREGIPLPPVEDDTDEERTDPGLIQVNVFELNDEDWDWDKEVQARAQNPGEPYILHRDEYHRNEMDFTQTTLTYYEGDDIMVTEDDGQPLYNHLAVTGPLSFGHGSGDPNTVLVRNEDRRGEYEILRHPGKYSIEVLGLEIEDNERAKDLKHSNVRKFRDSD